MAKQIEHWRKKQKEHWEKQVDLKSTHPDRYQNDLELMFMLEHIEGKTLNTGCGPGWETALSSEKTGYAVGLDLSPEMIQLAQQYKNEYNDFIVADITDMDNVIEKYGKFDSITTRRILINLKGWNDQKKALDEMTRVLAPKGKLIIIEATQEGYDELNELRKSLDLPIIKIAEYNNPLPIEKLSKHLEKNYSLIAESGLSTYYFLTRVYYPLIEKPKYNTKFGEQAMRLQIQCGDININSPLLMRVYKKN